MTGSHKVLLLLHTSIGDKGHKKARSNAASEYVNFIRSQADKRGDSTKQAFKLSAT
jgi:hypothetical protein